MTNEIPSPPSSRRTLGVGGVLVAIAVSAIVAGSGTWLITGRSGHDHGGSAEAGAKEQWQCPMHPSIVQDHPGDCPICGMKLVKVAGSTSAAETKGAAGSGEAQKEQWQCPMHPSIVQDHPGDCPICGMKLVKVAGGGGAGDGAGGGTAPEGLAGVTIDPARQQLIGMKIVHAERGPIGGTWRTNGRLAVDETRVTHVNVKFSGFMERVYADFIGKPIRRGQPLYAVYSPELLSAQEELLLALRTQKTMGGAGGAMSADGDALVRAARRKLELWDVAQAEIDRIEKAGEPSRTITFYAPASGVLTKKDVVPGMKVSAGDMPFEIIDLTHLWGLADAYETDLQNVKVGMKAALTLKAFPGRTFEGRVAFIDPLLDPKTRTAKVRIDFPNPTGDLRPEMFGEVVLSGRAREALRIPADAIIDSGTKSVVFIALGAGKFQPREVTPGASDGTSVEIVSGLAPGDGVVTRANFLVDSESRLRASLSALTGAGPSAGQAGGPKAAPSTPASGGDAAGANPHAGHGR
ncbi:MAG: efflux RND transporter periplasmic adaptor subunit [Anaeromyxobacteraceae bacterium]